MSSQRTVRPLALDTRNARLIRKLLIYAGLCLAAFLLIASVLVVLFADTLVNRYGKGKIEGIFARQHPGYTLRIGELHYSSGFNRLIANSVSLSSTNSKINVGQISLTGVRWPRLLVGSAVLTNVLAGARFEATHLVADYPDSLYRIGCERLDASMPLSELILEDTELRPLVSDEEFFAAHEFRTTRFHVVVPECRVSGVAYGELLEGKSYRARSVTISRPSFDAFVNCDRLTPPFVKSPLMLHEALVSIPSPLHLDNLTITNGHLNYAERRMAGAEPGVLTFGAVHISVENLANRAEVTPAIQIQAQGDLMEAGTLKVLMSIPTTTPDFALHYSGSLSAMDLTRLNAFLENAEYTRIKSGVAQRAEFDIDIAAGQARGKLRGIYIDLEISVLNQATGIEKRTASFLANVLKIRHSNVPDRAGSLKEGQINYARRPENEFLQVVWFSLRSGVLDLIEH